MSEQGSFVTEWIGCDKCLEHAKKELLGKEKWLCSLVLPGYHDGARDFPIIAGKLGGGWDGGMVLDMERAVERLQHVLCHPLRLAVLTETSATVLVAMPAPSSGDAPNLG